MTKNYIFLLLITLFSMSCKTPSQPNTAQSSSQGTDRYFTTSDGVKLHYRVSGSGKPLVIFPGYGQDITKLANVYNE